LLSGEYFVLDGAKALALPTRLGQSLSIQKKNTPNVLQWTSFDQDKSIWFEGTFNLPTLELLNSSDLATGQRLQEILQAVKKSNPIFCTNYTGLKVTTKLTFPKNWGLGTSSTLLHLLGQWAGIDPYQLLFDTMGGSGYDIACADAKGPILYTKKNNQNILVETLSFDPSFKDQIYFIYLDKKQNSREGIQRYRSKIKTNTTLIDDFSTLTTQFIQADSLSVFEDLIQKHEANVAACLELQQVQELYFSDYWGRVKSLGAWGGDFVLATSNKSISETKDYFNSKGLEVFIKYEDLILEYEVV